MAHMNGINVSVARDMTDIMNHSTAVIHQDVYALNHEHFEGYQWIAVLDSKTCPICAVLDNRIFTRLPNMKGGGSEAPDQPIHENCRCVMAPVLIGASDIMTDGPNYEEWFNRQSDATKLDILGPSRFHLYRQGMRITQFARDDKILTLEQLGAQRLTRKELLDAGQNNTMPVTMPENTTVRNFNLPLSSSQWIEYREFLVNQLADIKGLPSAKAGQWADAILERMSRLPPKMQHLIVQNKSRISIGGTRAFFDSEGNTIHLPINRITTAGKNLDTFFHEMGHAIDWQYQVSGQRPSSTLALRVDYDAFVGRARALGKTSQINQKLQGYARGDVSDIFGGLSRGRFEGDYFHSQSYWRRKGRIEAESFAHLFSARQSDSRTHFKEFFPTADKQFQQWLDNLTFGL